jgi:hypothetical protein
MQLGAGLHCLYSWVSEENIMVGFLSFGVLGQAVNSYSECVLVASSCWNMNSPTQPWAIPLPELF